MFDDNFQLVSGRAIRVSQPGDVVPVASKYASLSGYNSNFNNPVNYADPLGDDPPGGGWFSRFLDFFKSRPVNEGNPITLNLVETFARRIRSVPIRIESAIVTNSSSLESGVMYTTESYIALEVAAQRRSQLQQSVALRDLYNSLREIHGNNFPTSPSTRIDVVKEYIPDWKDRWGASDNLLAEMTYKPIDGAWTTIQSLNPFLDRSAISHVDGRMATETERVEGMVNVTAEVVGNEVIGQAIKVAVPLMGRVVAKEGGRVFWSGEGAMDAAMNYAKSTGGTTLEMTRAGQNLQKLIQTKNIPWSEARPMWQRLSTVYAKGANGTAHFFPGTTVNPGSIWLNVEKPILLNNGIKIITH